MPFVSNLDSTTLGRFISLKWAQEMNSAIACARFMGVAVLSHLYASWDLTLSWVLRELLNLQHPSEFPT